MAGMGLLKVRYRGKNGTFESSLMWQGWDFQKFAIGQGWDFQKFALDGRDGASKSSL